MANRLVGSVYILDTTTANLSYINGRISAIGFYGADTTARLTLTYVSSTLDSIVAFAPATLGSIPWDDHKSFGPGFQMADTMRVLNLTAGTGWIYFV